MRSAFSQRFPEVKPVWINNKLQAIAHLKTCAMDADKCPRLIIANLYLPSREEGFDLLNFISQYAFHRKPPVIVISASTADDDIASVYGTGVASYIMKPDNYANWLTCINSLRRYWWEVR